MKIKKILIIILSIIFYANTANATYNIALVLSDNKSSQQTSIEVEQGVKFAIEEINSNGGIKGQEVKLRIYDDYCNEKKAINIANDIVSDKDKYSAVIGHLCFNTIEATAKIYDEAKIINIVPIAVNEDIKATTYKGFLKLSGNKEEQAQSFVDYISKNYGSEKIAILNDGSFRNHQVTKDIKNKLFDTKFRDSVFYAQYTPGESGYNKLISQLNDMNIDILYLSGELEDIKNIAISAIEKDAKFDIYANNTAEKDEIEETLKGIKKEIKFTSMTDFHDNPKTAPLISKLRISGIDFTKNVILGYTSAEVISNCLKKVKKSDKIYDEITSYLAKNSVKTSIAKLSFDLGNVINPSDYRVFSFKGNEYTQVK